MEPAEYVPMHHRNLILRWLPMCIIALPVLAAPAADDWRPYRHSLDDEGVYLLDPGTLAGAPLPQPRRPQAEIRRRFRPGPGRSVRCRLVDWVDCRKTDHDYVEGGGASRVLRLAGQEYRVTPGGRDLSWFAYRLATKARPGRPYLLVARLVNDRERYTTVTCTVPKGSAWAAPYAGEERFHADCMEDDSFRPDVGGAVYTGREFPLDGKPYLYSYLVYPKAERLKVTISHYPAEEDKNQAENGAAVSHLWLFEVLDSLPPAEPPSPPVPERAIGLYVPHAWYLYAHYGVPARTVEQRRESLRAFLQYLRFCGFNLLEFHVINGSDVARRAWYDSKLYPPLQGDLLKELLPLAEEQGIRVMPIVAPVLLEKQERPSDTPDAHGFSRLSLQYTRDDTYLESFGMRPPDPLRPETQAWMIACLREIAERCRGYRCVPAIGFRVNGKFGMCYAGDRVDRCGQDSGFSEWDVAQFRKETGVPVPETAGKGSAAYAWLRANAWERWTDWRCRRMRAFWLSARDALRAVRPEWRLLVACDLPSEYPGSNIEWPAESPREVLRHHGYDPELFKADEGLLIQRGMMINSDRFFSKWGPPHGSNYRRHKEFHYAPGVVEAYARPDGSGVEFYHNYWEEVPHPDNEFGPDLRTATGAPLLRNYFEPACFSLARGNVFTMAFMGWERASIGHEADLRRFSRAFRSLPAVPPRAFAGKLAIEPAAAPAGVPDRGVTAQWFGDVLALVNDSAVPRRATLRLERARAGRWQAVDLGSGEVLGSGAGRQVTLAVPLDAFDVRAIAGVGR